MPGKSWEPCQNEPLNQTKLQQIDSVAEAKQVLLSQELHTKNHVTGRHTQLPSGAVSCPGPGVRRSRLLAFRAQWLMPRISLFPSCTSFHRAHDPPQQNPPQKYGKVWIRMKRLIRANQWCNTFLINAY